MANLFEPPGLFCHSQPSQQTAPSTSDSPFFHALGWLIVGTQPCPTSGRSSKPLTGERCSKGTAAAAESMSTRPPAHRAGTRFQARSRPPGSAAGESPPVTPNRSPSKPLLREKDEAVSWAIKLLPECPLHAKRSRYVATVSKPARVVVSRCPEGGWRIQPVVATIGFSGSDSRRCMA